MNHRLLSILNLLVLVFYLIRPTLPWVEYVLNKKYIEKFLCVERDNPENSCHGKCHLQEELEKSVKTVDERSDNNRKPLPDRRMEDHVKSVVINQLNSILSFSLFPNPSISLPVPWYGDIFVPPEE